MFTTDDFTYKNGTFSAEISDFGLGRWEGLFKPLGRGMGLQGFRLKSARTGVIITMTLDQPHYDRDNDLTHWTFKTLDCDEIDHLVVFND